MNRTGSDDGGVMTGAVIQDDQSVWGGYDAQAAGLEQRLVP